MESIAADEPGGAEITALLRAIGSGDRAAMDRLFEIVYGELRGIARRLRRGGGPNSTLDTTALVHEAYLKLSRRESWILQDRLHFYRLAARAMRALVIDRARHHGRQKRGGDGERVTLDERLLESPTRADHLVALDGALSRLEGTAPELAQIVEWKFFAGLGFDEIAALQEISERTLRRRWTAARAFLYRELAAQGMTA